MNNERFLRIWQIIGCGKRGFAPIIPVSRATWWNGVKCGKFPKPIKIGPNITAWVSQDIEDLVRKLKGE